MRKIKNKSFTTLLVNQQEQEPSGQLEERDSLFRLQPINKTNDLILNLTPENVTQHFRIVTTTRKGS